MKKAPANSPRRVTPEDINRIKESIRRSIRDFLSTDISTLRVGFLLFEAHYKQLLAVMPPHQAFEHARRIWNEMFEKILEEKNIKPV